MKPRAAWKKAKAPPRKRISRGTRWFVYLLRCRDGSLYCGITNELEARCATHNAGKGAKYTRSRLPCALVYFENAKSYGAALKREYAIKQLSKREKEMLIGKPCR